MELADFLEIGLTAEKKEKKIKLVLGTDANEKNLKKEVWQQITTEL